MSLSNITFATSSSKVKIAPRISTECHFMEKKQMKKYYLSSLENCERRIRTPVLQLMRLASYHCSTSLCVPHTRHVVSDLRLCGLRTFTANRIMFHCCTYFFRFCIHKPSKLLPDASIMFSQNNNTLLYCCYDIFNLYTVLIRIHTAEG